MWPREESVLSIIKEQTCSLNKYDWQTDWNFDLEHSRLVGYIFTHYFIG